MAFFDFVEGWYDPPRRHSGIDGPSPIKYEKQINQQLDPTCVSPSDEATTGGTRRAWYLPLGPT